MATPKSNIDQALLKFRAKRKWQIALRRYVIHKMGGVSYAPYFGLDVASFRKWIELQFDTDIDWADFSAKWQFDHIIPVTYFDFENESDLRLCWNFINIRVEKFELKKTRANRPDIPAAKIFFETLYEKTRYGQAFLMLQKIDQIETPKIAGSDKQEDFIVQNIDYLNTIAGFSEYEFDKLNYGIAPVEILSERDLLKKFS